jgi:muramoyltetrapeptide carboxypeptidase
MVAADFARGLAEDELASLLGTLGDDPEPVFPLAGALLGADGAEQAEGQLLGGCLSLLAATAGTPYAPDLSGSLLFIEDVGEPAYRLDRMLVQLRQAGQLDAIRAIIVGHLTALGGRRLAAGEEANEANSLLAVFREHATALGVPLAWGLAAGHDAPNWTLPLGATALLDLSSLAPSSLAQGPEAAAPRLRLRFE